ncbi:hypothetical protein H0H92_001920 [Tricholoma furcatifolium]|nr:hypothetical protein H0H92_001920 [Tricholoma furcatifolium]
MIRTGSVPPTFATRARPPSFPSVPTSLATPSPRQRIQTLSSPHVDFDLLGEVAASDGVGDWAIERELKRVTSFVRLLSWATMELTVNFKSRVRGLDLQVFLEI